MDLNGQKCIWKLNKMSTDGSIQITYILRKGNTTIGRAIYNDIQAPSLLSSRQHCIVTLTSDGYVFLKDTSTNGTVVGSDVVVHQDYKVLHNGDLFGLGCQPKDQTGAHQIVPSAEGDVYTITCMQITKDDVIYQDNKYVVPFIILNESVTQAPPVVIDITNEEELTHQDCIYKEGNIESSSKKESTNSTMTSKTVESALVNSNSHKVKDSENCDNIVDITEVTVRKQFSNADEIPEVIVIDGPNNKLLQTSAVSIRQEPDNAGNNSAIVAKKKVETVNNTLEEEVKKETVNNIDSEFTYNKLDKMSVKMSNSSASDGCNVDTASAEVPREKPSSTVGQWGSCDDNVDITLASGIEPCSAVCEDRLSITKPKMHPEKSLQKLIDSDCPVSDEDGFSICISNLTSSSECENQQIPSPLKTALEVDARIQDIVERRLGSKSDKDNNILVDQAEKKSECSKQYDSFTVFDDDIICIEDSNSYLPCSQMFEIKTEPKEKNVIQADEEYLLDNDDNVSEADSVNSTDNWIQRLSQSFSLNVEDFNIEENASVAINNDEAKILQKKTTNNVEGGRQYQSTKRKINSDKDVTQSKCKYIKHLEGDEEVNQCKKEKKTQDKYLEEEMSEPIIRTSKGGSKRKLPDFSDSEDENNTVNVNKITNDGVINIGIQNTEKSVNGTKYKVEKTISIYGNKTISESDQIDKDKHKTSINSNNKRNTNNQVKLEVDIFKDILNLNDDCESSPDNEINKNEDATESIRPLIRENSTTKSVNGDINVSPLTDSDSKSIGMFNTKGSSGKKICTTARKRTSKLSSVVRLDKKKKPPLNPNVCSGSVSNLNSEITSNTNKNNDTPPWLDFTDMILRKVNLMEEEISPKLVQETIDLKTSVRSSRDDTFFDGNADLNDKIEEAQVSGHSKNTDSPDNKLKNHFKQDNEKTEDNNLKGKYNTKCPKTRKFEEVCKKIVETKKKSSIEIIEAKSLPARRKSVVGENIPQDSKETKSILPEKWISKEQSQIATNKSKISESERKAQVKAKLADIAKKNAVSNIQDEKPKRATSAKQNTKVTTKSRNELFLDNLVSNKSAAMSNFKIPRRSLSVDLEEQKSSDLLAKTNETFTYETLPVTNKSTPNKIKPFSITEPVDPIKSTRRDFKPGVPPVPQSCVYNKENNDSIEIKMLSDLSICEPNKNITCLKSVLKKEEVMSTKKCKTNRKVHFHYPGESENVIYVGSRVHLIDPGCILKPLTKEITKIEAPPQTVIQVKRAPHVDYSEELYLDICRWNTMWFEECKKFKGEPKVFEGQVFSLKNDFISYSDYRRGFYPMLLYQQWQILSREHDFITNRKYQRSFGFEIKSMSIQDIKNRANPGSNSNLLQIDAQVLLDREKNETHPKAGDLVVYDGMIKHPSGNKYNQRKLCYIMKTDTKPIRLQKDVCPRLRKESPKASIVMDFALITKVSRYPIDKSEPTKIAVLKCIKPDLRVFNALDQLPVSPLCNMILRPTENNVSLPPIDFKTLCKENQSLNDSQKKAVLHVTKSCLSRRPFIHLIQGPPGCGKSEVVTGIFKQLMSESHKNKNGHFQILLCAPSNAAVDELVYRLGKIQETLKKKKFTMIRVGRTEMLNRDVTRYSLENMVETELKKQREVVNDPDHRDTELRNLQAKVNRMTQQLENHTIHKKNDLNCIRSIEMKLAETIQQMRNLESGKCKDMLDGKGLRNWKKDCEQTLIQKAHVIATTLSSCVLPEMTQAFSTGKLNLACCIVDEATQSTEPETLIPLMLGVTNLVLVGDPQQLPATVLSQKAKEHGFQKSLFARQQDCWIHYLKEKPTAQEVYESRCHFLNVQYRMDPAIVQWPSAHFYGGRIVSKPGLEDRQPNCPLLPYVILSHEFLQTKNEENKMEVELIVSLVKSIGRDCRCNKMNIGIITPYNSQRIAIKKELCSEELSNLEVDVGTVDSYQGKERDIILFSCVRTEGIGFMSITERLNVALTRAKHSLIVCGNFVSLQNDQTWASLINNAKCRNLFLKLSPSDVFNIPKGAYRKVCKPDAPVTTTFRT